jgi:hypothetical protein
MHALNVDEFDACIMVTHRDAQAIPDQWLGQLSSIWILTVVSDSRSAKSLL